MTVRIWQSYSCNNSSSYRLIARFVDAAAARDAAEQLTAVFTAHAEALGRHGNGPDSLLHALAQSFGHEWYDEGWGGSDDGPFVFAEGEHVFVHHHYCLGLGPGVPAFLGARGAELGAETWADVAMSVLLRAPANNARFDDDLAALFAQPRDTTDYKGPAFRGPWSSVDSRGRAAWFRDTGTIGLYVPVGAMQIADVKRWLAGHGIEGASIRFDEPADEKLFTMLAAARCTACDGALEYLDPRLHDIETPQLVCKPCGGLYEPAAFFRD
ncbi:MAG: hypothetical protein ABI867_19170 [Kofleriaceae bacterium]